MEADSGKLQRSRQKRRDRPLQLQQGSQPGEDEAGTGRPDDHRLESPPRSSKDINNKCHRSAKPKKGKSALFEEDIVDGFAILSFKTLEELEMVTRKNGCVKPNPALDEDTSLKDSNSLDETDDGVGNKTKKKNRKNGTTGGNFVSNCINHNLPDMDNNSHNTPANKNVHFLGSTNNNNNPLGQDGGRHLDNVVPPAGLGHQLSEHKQQVSGRTQHQRPDLLRQHSTGSLEAPSSVSRDRLSDCDVDIGDDKASECGSDLYPGVTVGGILQHITRDVQNTCEALTAPTPPPSTSSTPTTLFNGLGGCPHPTEATLSPSPVPPVLVSTTTATTNTTTSSSPGRPSSGHSLTSPSAAVVSTSSAALLPSQSVIPPAYHLHPEQGPKLSPVSSLPANSHNSRTFSPISIVPYSDQARSTGGNSDSSSCARSLQYSKLHKSGQVPCKSKDSPSAHPPTPQLVPASSPHYSQQPHFLGLDSPRPASQYYPQSQHGPPGNFNLHPGQLTQGFSYHNFPHGGKYSSPPILRPEPLLNNHSSASEASESKLDQTSPSGGTQLTNSGPPGQPPNLQLISPQSRNSHHHHRHSPHQQQQQQQHQQQQQQQHHPSLYHQQQQQPYHHLPHPHLQFSGSSSSADHRSSSSSHRSNHSPHHGHKQSSRDRPLSPNTQLSKRVCRTPPLSGPQVQPVHSSSGHSAISFSDAGRHLGSPGQSRPPGHKLDILNVTGSSDKSLQDKSHFKECKSSVDPHHSQHHHPHQHLVQSKDHHRDKHREREREKPSVPQVQTLASAPFSSTKTAWPNSAPVSLYNPLLPTHSHHHPHHQSPLTSASSSSLHPLGSSTTLSSASLGPHPSPLLPLPLGPAPPLLAAAAPSSSLPGGMFAPPIHPGPPSLPAPPSLSSHPGVATTAGQFSESLLRGQDFLHQDLSNRLLAHHETAASIGLPPPSSFVRSETHQHQHQHLHNHMHQHTYGGLSAGPLLPPAPPLFEKIPKAFEAGVFRPSFDKVPKAFEAGIFRPSVSSIVPNYSAAFASLLPPGPSGSSLASSLQGAFQPKKQGKWCAVHVRVAWEIYHRQQKKLLKDQEPSSAGKDSKPLEPLLRPSSHLLPGGLSSAPRPAETSGHLLPGVVSAARSQESSVLASVARVLPEAITPVSSSFLSSASQLGLSPFARPSPYQPTSFLNPLGFSGLGSSVFAPPHEMPPPPGLAPGFSSSPHEWNRLHRTPSSFPTWPKSDVEREKERDKERDRDLRKEDDRDRRASVSHGLSSLEESRLVDSSRPKSRSRSRSPLVNGRLDHHSKSSELYEKRPLSSSSLKLKEDELPGLSHHLAEREARARLEREKIERDRLERDRLERERMDRERMEKEKQLFQSAAAEREKQLLLEQREKLLQTSGYLGLGSFGATLPGHPGLLDRRMGLIGHPGAAYPFLDRPPVPASMWNPFDKSAAELAHRMEVERERERVVMISRLSSMQGHLAGLDQERLKEHIQREQQEREYEFRRQYLDRLPSFSADRLRAVDPLALGSYFPRTISPMFMPAGLAGLKSNSPHGMPVVPPPLIHSSSSVSASMLSRSSHDNSPSSSSKSKGCSPADSTTDLKDKREAGSSADVDAHLR